VGEFLAVAGIGIWGTHRAAAQPFCSRCMTWKEQRPLGTLKEPAEEAIEALKEGDVAALRPGDSPLRLTLSICPNCRKGKIDVKLERVTLNAQNHEKKKELVHLIYPRRALEVFEEVMSDDT
jgi:hypothetical protein